MPLLKKKTLKKAPMPEYLRDDEYVFHCEMTNEIFRDYDEFAERTILCNSMVWTCSMTGKSNLTYVEALQSEENAKKSLKDFQLALQKAVIFLANQTKRSAFGEMAEDVFMFMKDRFFVGEIVEPPFSGSKWKEYKVTQVIAPTEEEIKKASKGSPSERQFYPPASLFKYSLETVDADGDDISETVVVDFSKTRRRKGAYSRDKNKLLLKQHVEQNSEGMWMIKKSSLEHFGVKDMKFNQIFDGPLPDFETSKKIEKKATALNGKKVKQETLAKFLSKNNITDSGEKKKAKNSLLEKMKKKEAEYRQMKEDMKQRKAEEKLAEKLKKKEENIQISIMLREWYKPKEDQELEDQQKLPEPTSVESKILDRYLGDVLMVIEFVHSFAQILDTKDFFPGGLSLDLMERALLEKEVAGPFTDLIQMFLSAIFNLQEQETTQYKTEAVSVSTKDLKNEDADDLSMEKAMRYTTLASKWSNTHLGVPLFKLPLYSLTVSEVLRLHLLMSGSKISSSGLQWRYQQRGGYECDDDPGLYFLLHQSYIMKALSNHNVVQFSVGDKLKILTCLINQLLTYAEVRDIIEDRLDAQKQAKLDYRSTHASERKRKQEFVTAKMQLKRENGDNLEYINNTLAKMIKDAEKKQADNEKKLKHLNKISNENVNFLGTDRAFRQYIKLDSIPGLFVNDEEPNAGPCYDEVVPQNQKLVNADRQVIIGHIREIHEEMNSSDKENSQNKSKVKNSPLVVDPEKARENHMCSADPNVCVVHSTTLEKTKWSFYHEPEQVENLLTSLNKRGIRESDLLQNLESGNDSVLNIIEQCPYHQLNPKLEPKEQDDNAKTRASKKGKKRGYEDANLGFPSDAPPVDVLHNIMIDNILEIEDKLHAGNLGTLNVKDRNLWRENLHNRNYNNLEKTIIKYENGTLPSLEKVKSEGKNNSRASTPDSIDEEKEKRKEYCDPGVFLGPKLDIPNTSFDSDDPLLEYSEELETAIKTLAIALVQVSQAIDPKYIKKPLGTADFKPKKDSKKDDIHGILRNWQESLLAATSFSQIFLHYGILDSCIMWSRSALLAKCRICRRQKDSENMLLCDGCNNGHHLYCLKPILKAVPVGDWYCPKCVAETQPKIENPEPVVKKRRIFRDEDIDDDDEEEEEVKVNGIKDEPDSDSEQSSEADSNDDQTNGDAMKVDLCTMCGSGGELLFCDKCPSCYHLECIAPPLRRAPRGKWTCTKCVEKEKSKESSSSRVHYRGSRKDDDMYVVYGVVAQRPRSVIAQRRCAARARHKIYDFIKSLRGSGCSDDSDSEEVMNHRRSKRRDDGRDDLPLHNAALQELLADVMKHNDAWPFIRPVQKTEVPDYYDVIRKPMDFGTIKYKLNMGNYKCDADLMSDTVLVFENCNTYNNSDALVYKCGVRLLRHFIKKCKELNLKLPEEMQDDEDVEEQPKAKKRRTH